MGGGQKSSIRTYPINKFGLSCSLVYRIFDRSKFLYLALYLIVVYLHLSSLGLGLGIGLGIGLQLGLEKKVVY